MLQLLVCQLKEKEVECHVGVYNSGAYCLVKG